MLPTIQIQAARHLRDRCYLSLYVSGLFVLLANLDAYEHTDTGTITSLARGRRMFALPGLISHYHHTTPPYMPSPAVRHFNVVMVRMDETSVERLGSILRRLSACYARSV